MKRGWQLGALIAFVAAIGTAVILAQACGGGSTDIDVTPTATTPPTSTAGVGAPDTGDITPGAGAPGRMLSIGGASEEFAAFLGISFEQLESELDAEGATPGSVAEAHGRTREELEDFFIEQLEAELNEAVAAGTMSQEEADNMFESQASRIDDIIDGSMPSGMPSGGPQFPSDGQ
jgi:hypothetical protein